jgi:hypothetical protein
MVEALDAWRKCAEFVARYTCQMMPQSLNLNTPLAGYLTVINLSAPRSDQGAPILTAHGLDMEVKGNATDDGT